MFLVLIKLLNGGRRMKKIKGLIFICAIFLGTSMSFGQGHLLISEFVVSPTDGEFIEICNPTADSIDLTNYYLSDHISSNNNNYIHIVEPGYAVLGSTDFTVKFPDGLKIAPGEYLVIAFSGTGFTAEYGVAADLEIKGDDAATPDMVAISVGASSPLCYLITPSRM